jgi:hypothetical protein
MFGVDPITRFVCGSESMKIDQDDMARKMSMPATVKGAEGTQAEDLREFKIAVVLREDIDSVMKRRGETDEEVAQYFVKVVGSMAQVYAQELNVHLYMGYFEKYTQDEPSGYFYDGRQPGELLDEQRRSRYSAPVCTDPSGRGLICWRYCLPRPALQ